MEKILVIAAHPDDEVLGCGGTIAKHSRRGDLVYCLILGGGIASRSIPGGNESIAEEQSLLQAATRQAAKILGITEMFFEDFPDQRYDSVDFLRIVQAIEKIKQEIQPTIVYTHHQGDLNLDHQIVFRAALTAFRPLPGESVKNFYSFEAPSSTEWGAPNRSDYFKPNVFVDVSETFDKKLEALCAYQSELREYPHPRSAQALEALARMRGAAVGKVRAESFELIREIK